MFIIWEDWAAYLLLDALAGMISAAMSQKTATSLFFLPHTWESTRMVELDKYSEKANVKQAVLVGQPLAR